MISVCCTITITANMVAHRSAAADGMSVEAFGGDLRNSLLFTEESLAVVKQVWKEQGPALCALPKQVLTVGEVRLTVCHAGL